MEVEDQWVRIVDDHDIIKGKINTHSRIQATLENLPIFFSSVVCKRLEDSCFGQFMAIKNISFFGQIVHNIIIRLVDHPKEGDAVFFEIGDDVGRFSIKEFALITYLKCVGNRMLRSVKGQGRLHLLYFLTHKHINSEVVEAILQSVKRYESKDDAVKLGLLYLLTNVVLGNTKTYHLPQEYLVLLDDFEAFNSVPWGIVLYEILRDSIKGIVNNKVSSIEKLGRNCYTLMGFP